MLGNEPCFGHSFRKTFFFLKLPPMLPVIFDIPVVEMLFKKVCAIVVSIHPIINITMVVKSMWLWPTVKRGMENIPNTKKRNVHWSLDLLSLWSQTTSAHLASRSHPEVPSHFALRQFPMIECNWDQITPPTLSSLSLITSDLAPAQLWHTGRHFLGGLGPLV